METANKFLLDYVKDYQAKGNTAIDALIKVTEYDTVPNGKENFHLTKTVYQDKALNAMYRKLVNEYKEKIDQQEIESLFQEGVFTAFQKLAERDLSRYTAKQILSYFHKTIRGLLQTESHNRNGCYQQNEAETKQYYTDLEQQLSNPNLPDEMRAEIEDELMNRVKRKTRFFSTIADDFNEEFDDSDDNPSIPLAVKVAFAASLDIGAKTDNINCFLQSIDIERIFWNAPVQYKVFQLMCKHFDSRTGTFNQQQIRRELGRAEGSNINQEVEAIRTKLRNHFEAYTDYMKIRRNLTQQIILFLEEYSKIRKFDKQNAFDYFGFTYDFIKNNNHFRDILCDSKYMDQRTWKKLQKILDDDTFDSANNFYTHNDKKEYLRDSKETISNAVISALQEHVKRNKKYISDFISYITSNNKKLA